MDSLNEAGPKVSFARWAAAVAFLLTAAALLVLVFFPGSSLASVVSERLGVAHLLAFSAIFGLVLILGAVCAITVLLAQRRILRRSPGLRSVTISATVMLLLAGLGLVLWPSGSSVPVEAEQSADGARGTLTVAVYNSQDTLTAADLLQLDRLGNPDVIVLPEGGEYAAERAIASSGLPFTVHSTRDQGFTAAYSGGIAPTTILTRADRIQFTQNDALPTSFGSVSLTSADRAGYSILGVHSAPPLPALMDAWRTDLKTIAESAASEIPDIIAGDFNATLRHGPLARIQGYKDASLACSARGVGTWPLSLPDSLAAPIDHVLVRSDTKIQRCASSQIGHGDHRAVIVTIAR
ncbi:endonuclease/exonuclease/phosphatase family protein [Mycetocola tolaasinivorans]|uniref:endonuclease/exonuclease/phosphatase family protein n=1 Tax=Mycetocola tolaasinivorans TaxID=76635 RepID=UPI0011C4A36D|nr:endonuclease/exonuclease/phosphatase family protein [Mycetocola tolaasinivorans]